MNAKKDILLRVYLLFLVFILLGFVIVYQIFNIQFKHGKYYRSISDSLTIKYATIDPIRGNIYSSDGRLLVTSLPVYDIHIDFKTGLWQDDKYYSENIDNFCALLASYFKDKPASEYKRSIRLAITSHERYYLLKRNINHNQLNDLKKFPFISQGRYKSGVVVEQKSKRITPFRYLAERTIGYKNPNVKGVGLEGSYNEYLEGKIGRRLIQRISRDVWIPINYENEVEPEDGKDIISTIDIDIQDITEEALMKSLIANNADNGCAVVMEVNTGHIKAIANLTKNEDNTYSENYNYAVGSATEPGSTFKLASSIVLLEKNIVNLNDIIETRNGVWKFYDREMKDSKPDGYGKISFREAFELSSNVAFARLISENFSSKPKEFISALDKLMITQPLNFSISGEGKPVFKKPGDKKWSGTTLPWMAVGYEMLVTPLQMLTLYNAVANNGVMVKPMFATEVHDCGRIVKKFETEVISQKICSNRTLSLVKAMMEGVVERGTASNIKSGIYKIAGKTGTSLVALQGSYVKKKTYQASFAGYFPAEKPKYSCIVVISNPSSGIFYGAYVAAPVFREIADKIYTSDHKKYAPLKPQYLADYNELPVVNFGLRQDFLYMSSFLGLNTRFASASGDWVKTQVSKENLWLTAGNPAAENMPDLKGMVLSDAVYLLENMGVKVIISGYGKIISQSILPGTPLIPPATVVLKLEKT